MAMTRSFEHHCICFICCFGSSNLTNTSSFLILTPDCALVMRTTWGFGLVCAVLCSTGLAVRTRGNSTEKKLAPRPALLLSFEALLRSGSQLLHLAADEKAQLLAVEDLSASNASNTSNASSERMLMDVGLALRHYHQHFFDETVCFTFDMFPQGMAGMPIGKQWKRLLKHSERLAAAGFASRGSDGLDVNDSNASNGSSSSGNTTELEISKREMQHFMFLSAMNDIFEVPLQMYEVAKLGEGKKSVAGLNCTPWLVNESRSMNLLEMLQAVGPAAPMGLDWWPSWGEEDEDASKLLRAVMGEMSGRGVATMSANFEYCVTDLGELLATKTLYQLTYRRHREDEANSTNATNMTNTTNATNSTDAAIGLLLAADDTFTLYESKQETALASAPRRLADLRTLKATYGVTGGECVNLTQGSVGSAEMDEDVNGKDRLNRINGEAGGHWTAAPYDFWKGVKVHEIIPSLGTEIGPLKLPLAGPQPSFMRRALPDSFDARAEWPNCNSIGVIRNQGSCGSCWAMAAATVMTDRFCVAFEMMNHTQKAKTGTDFGLGEDLEVLSLAPELLVQCDKTNNGCGGGRLDDAWRFLQTKGLPKESCAPYMHCPVPTQRSCDYGWEKRPYVPFRAAKEAAATAAKICEGHCEDGSPMEFFKVSQAFAAARPRDVGGMQRALLSGPLEVAYFVFSDFMSYKSGVYFRTPGAYGPLGGHAVRMLGWGTEEAFGKKPMDYWLIANSYSPRWGMHGLFKIRRGTNECGIETTPAAGVPDLRLVSGMAPVEPVEPVKP
ncbi:unnamed protein product [Effrenium voratum]|uniref:Peptidase C1A papain C-terminal domain-containing protein n=1 Tax=Effrenium voratum TaxID=2562239 RepID=A0AA36JLK0_9DINO|nr:unnamed protein product [Effrenium voratum]